MATTTFKRSLARGFTLIELLIVVIILAILAAIAIPQFSNSTDDAQLAALDANLATVRSAIEQYRAQHNNTYPGAAKASDGTCDVGTAAAGAANSTEAFAAQLSGYSNDKGQVCSGPSTGYRFGPYLRKGIPVEPVSNSAVVAIQTTGVPLAPAANTAGYIYDTKSGQFVVNSNNPEKNGTRLLSAH